MTAYGARNFETEHLTPKNPMFVDRFETVGLKHSDASSICVIPVVK
ncbi:MAG: hypothetical protein GJU76_13055 [Gallionella sp.]|jgi:hypothetical protein|nr:hypothetical protein [Gallionella sp.]